MNHISILIVLIVAIGGLAGLTNYLLLYYKGMITQKWEVLRHLLSGIGAAILVPLLLNMMSSDLIRHTDDYDPINYFVFAGFCFVAGYFSDRFINTIGDKILKDIENTRNKADQALSQVQENEEKVDLLVSNEAEIEEEEVQTEPQIDLAGFRSQHQMADDDAQDQIDGVVNAFTGKYKFRTLEGITKELKSTTGVVRSLLEEMEKEGAAKRLTRQDGKTIWGLTHKGKMLTKK
ncbi:hypothetical protein GWK08_16370 [Leptobacterium flavescens]|uniref:YEATS-Like-Associating Three TM domain-containing protein n=1 Tax=Leptobacterium flavescens TaxID=472055 RepID=A0A6P0UR73_9FLAO|nr:YEATS-associated helix-containing protein [Leptobacterium flavescens]NER15032.1 hypothetical protein [Leptobacterium flavescens]